MNVEQAEENYFNSFHYQVKVVSIYFNAMLFKDLILAYQYTFLPKNIV
jgi:hypothetical protein